MPDLMTNFNAILVVLTLGAAALALADAVLLRPHRAAGQARPPAFDYAIGALPVLAVVTVLRCFVVEPFKIPSASMKPGLIEGDYIAVNKFVYGLRLPLFDVKLLDTGAPQRGDVMVFRFYDDPVTYIKRVVGLPGDRVVYANKRLSINGVPADYAPLPDYVDDVDLTVARQLREDRAGAPHRVLTMPGRPAGLIQAPADFPHRDACRYDEQGFACTVPAGHYFMMGDNRDNSIDSRYKGFVPDANIVGKASLIWMNLQRFDRIGSKL
jgi:signal peptidase I